MLYAFLAGRILFAFFHLSSAFNHFKSLDSYAKFAASKKVPAPKLAIIGSGLLLLAGGLSILLGLRPSLGVAALALFYLGVTPVMHNFWAVGPEQKQHDLINFMKNVALLGAALMFLAIPQPWPYSVRW
jgi:putative oxidoreductase